MKPSSLFAERAFLPSGWARDVRFEIGPEGNLLSVTPEATPGSAPQAPGPVLPGMPNLHSHAFQRAMAGLTERAGPGEDSFWTWREVMYRFVRRLGPEQLEAIAAQLYVEMLKSGYTAVGEFHYLHHDPQGRPYADPAEMSLRIAAAAEASGIGLTHLPVLYGFGCFGGQAAGEAQRRFLNDPVRLLEIVQSLHRMQTDNGQLRVGVAPHSLRAVTPETLRAVVEGITAIDPAAPIHIHIAEQVKEVHDCIEWSGQRPVEWLLAEMDLGPRWCLVHATHITDEESEALARSGAVVGLCPTTEANLGDGVFPGPSYLAHGGRFGIGSDSHISVSPVEELRLFEYGQRLTHRRRNLLVQPGHSQSLGTALYGRALEGGAQALGRPIGRLEAGCRADLIVLDAERPTLVGRSGEQLLDSFLFAGNDNPISHVMVGGHWLVEDGHHRDEERTFARFKTAIIDLQD